MAARSWRCVLSLALVVVAGMMVATQIMLTRNQATTSDVLSAARHWATGDGGYTEGEVTERRRGAAGAPRPLMQAPIIPPRPAHPAHLSHPPAALLHADDGGDGGDDDDPEARAQQDEEECVVPPAAHEPLLEQLHAAVVSLHRTQALDGSAALTFRVELANGVTALWTPQTMDSKQNVHAEVAAYHTSRVLGLQAHTVPCILAAFPAEGLITHLENSEEPEDDTLARYLAHVLRDGGGTASILPPNQVPRVDAAAVVGVLSFAMTRPQAGVQLAPLWPVPPVWTELLHQGHGNPTWAQASAGGSSAAALAAHHSSSRGKVAGEVGPATARRWYRTMSSMVLFDFLIYNHGNRLAPRHMLVVKQAVVDPQAANLTLQQATEVAIGEPVEAAALPPRAAAQVVATWTADDVAHDVWVDGMPLLFTGHSQAFSDEGDTVADSTKAAYVSTLGLHAGGAAHTGPLCVFDRVIAQRVWDLASTGTPLSHLLHDLWAGSTHLHHAAGLHFEVVATSAADDDADDDGAADDDGDAGGVSGGGGGRSRLSRAAEAVGSGSARWHTLDNDRSSRLRSKTGSAQGRAGPSGKGSQLLHAAGALHAVPDLLLTQRQRDGMDARWARLLQHIRTCVETYGVSASLLADE